MTRQLQIDFEGGLVQRFPEFRDVVRASVYSCPRALKQVAADLDMTSSELSRKLSETPQDPVHFPLSRLPALLAATGDLRPLYWLIETYLEDDSTKKQRVIAEAADAVRKLQAILSEIDPPTMLKVAR